MNPVDADTHTAAIVPDSANPIRNVWLAIALFIGLLAVAVLLAYRVAATRAEQQATSLVRLVEEHATSTMGRADVSLRAALDRLTPADIRAGQRMSEPRRAELGKMLAQIQARTAGLVIIALADADGIVYANSIGVPPGSDLSDRPYFRLLSKERLETPAVSEVVQGRVSGKWGIQVVRRIEFPDGSFAGVAVANLGLTENFERFYATLDIGPDSLISLRDRDNRVLVRFPVAPHLLGKPISGTATNRMIETGANEGVFRAISPVDGIDRVVALRKLPDHPIYALVGISAAFAFKLWRLEALAAALLGIAALLIGKYVTTILRARLQTALALKNLNDQLEQRVAERTASLQQAIGDLEAFSYSASHDLRAPLRAINGYASILADGEKAHLSEEGRGMLDRIAHNAAKMGRLIDDILAYSRAGRQPLQRNTVDLGALATTVADDLHASYPRTEIVIGPLPMVAGDATMLTQVLQNLMDNACKFSAKEEQPRVELGFHDHNGLYECYVRDNGVGFDPRYAQKMFTMFQRMHPEKEFPGTGVGLAIVQRLITRHGGSIRAESEPGQGAIFRFMLPPPA